MTHDTEALSGLLAKIEAATGPDQVIDAHLVCVLLAPPEAFVSIGPISGMARVCIGVNARGADIVWGHWIKWIDTPLTASIDAALALVERVLPGHKAGFQPGIAGKFRGHILAITPTSAFYVMDTIAPTAPLAILGSLLKVLINRSASAALAQGGHHEA